MSKIDTQGMSGGQVKGCTDNVFPKDADGNPIYPPFDPPPLPIFDVKERAELKQIMLEALREYHTGYNDSPWTLDDFQE
tara:strand:+ start:312 stop:548 length:237 start_codon:yes stop_codon:yes gene_type:complete